MPLIHAEKPASITGPTFKDFDHSWFFSGDPGFKGDDGKALKYSVGQRTVRWEHELKNRFALPPQLPERGDGYFKAIVAGCGRLVGPYAIDFTKDDWTELVLMTPAQYARVIDPGRMYIQDEHSRRRFPVIRDHLGRYFAAYALEHGLDHISEKTIDEFLGTKDPAVRAKLGNLMLQQSIEASIAPVVPSIAELQQMSPISRRRVDLRKVINRFFPDDKFPDYYGALADRLERLQWA